MKIGDLVLIRNGGAYGLYNLDNSRGEILETGRACVLVDKIVLGKLGTLNGIRTTYYTVFCKVSVNNSTVWLPEGMLQKPGKKLLWSYIKKYAKKPKIY
jgi:hypothetical protein